MLWKTSPEKQGHPSLDTAVHIRHQQNRHPPHTATRQQKAAHSLLSSAWERKLSRWRRRKTGSESSDSPDSSKEIYAGRVRSKFVNTTATERVYLQGCNYIYATRPQCGFSGASPVGFAGVAGLALVGDPGNELVRCSSRRLSKWQIGLPARKLVTTPQELVVRSTVEFT